MDLKLARILYFAVICIQLVISENMKRSELKTNNDMQNILEEMQAMKDKLANHESVIQKMNTRINDFEEENRRQLDIIKTIQNENIYLKQMCCSYTDKENDMQKHVHDYKTRNFTGYVSKSRKIRTESRTVHAVLEPVAFSAYLDHTMEHLGDHQPIVFNQLLYSTGSEYNKYTGIFTAPVSGIYLFSWSVGADPYGTHVAHEIWANLVINGVYQASATAESRADYDDNQGSVTLVLHVNKGEAVWVKQLSGNRIFATPTWRASTFSGVLLFED